MRRIGRWIVGVLAAFSLIVCVAMAALWVRSYWTTDRWSLARGRSNGSRFEDDRVALSICRGSIQFEHVRSLYEWIPLELKAGSWRFKHETWSGGSLLDLPNEAPPLWTLRDRGVVGKLGFSYWYGPVGPNSGFQEIGDFLTWPCWFVCAVTSAHVFLRVDAVRRRRQRRARILRGACPRCDYDLTANVSGVCPECGTVIAEAK